MAAAPDSASQSARVRNPGWLVVGQFQGPPAEPGWIRERERGEFGDVLQRDYRHGLIRREQVPVHAARDAIDADSHPGSAAVHYNRAGFGWTAQEAAESASRVKDSKDPDR